MAEPNITDLDRLPSSYQSSRAVWDVLVGDDAAEPLIKAITTGDNTTLQDLLSQLSWVETLFDRPHFIYDESRARQGPGDVREVEAMPMSTLARAVIIAAVHDQAAVITILLGIAVQQGKDPLSFIMRWAVKEAIERDNAAAFEALAQADPRVINYRELGHGTRPLYEAARMRSPGVFAVLLQLGADPLHPVGSDLQLGTYNSSLMARAALSSGPRMLELLFEHEVPIAGSGALHTAATYGHFDNARLLLAHGADVNEEITTWHRWTPMHFAAWMGEKDAMEFLQSVGARSDAKDNKGRTPAQIMKEYDGTRDWRKPKQSAATPSEIIT